MAVDALRADDKLLGDALLADYVQRYRSLVERLCRILLGDSGDAEDATQQTFLLAYQSLLNGTRPRNPRAWLCTIARRECWARDDRRRRERAVPREEARTEPDPAERTVLRAELATISAGLEQLPARQRQAIVLRELAGLSYTQLAAALEVSESAAEALLVRARRNLREARLVLFLLPLPNSLKRLFRVGSGHGRSAVGVSAAKAVAVATIVTATVAVSGSTVAAERGTSPAPVGAVRTTPAPAARVRHRRTPVLRAPVRHALVSRAARPRVATPTAALVHIETAATATAARSVAGDPGSSPTTAPSLSTSSESRPSAGPSSPSKEAKSPSPSAPRQRTTTPAPEQVAPPPAAKTPPATTTAAPPATTLPPTPTDTGPVTTPPPPTETTDTAPPAPAEPSGAESNGDGGTKPGNGNGDDHHDHTGDHSGKR